MHAGDEGVMGARQDGVEGRAEIGELGLGHTGVRSWGVTHLMTATIALSPFDFCCPSHWGCRQAEGSWDGHCLPTGNILTLKPVKQTGRQETLMDS